MIDIQNLYDSIIQNAKSKADWYGKAKIPVKNASRLIRFISIVFFGLGGLFPILGGILKVDTGSFDVTNWGYIAITIAGTLVFLDRFFGYSSAWIRYITTEMEIQKQIAEFEIKWKMETIGSDLQNTAESKVKELMKMLMDFSSLITELEKQETTSWATEFQSNIAELQKTINAKLETTSPGSVKITVRNEQNYHNLKVKIDNMGSSDVRGNTTLLTGVSVGHHLITVVGETGGKIVESAEVVTVDSNKLNTVEIKMP